CCSSRRLWVKIRGSVEEWLALGNNRRRSSYWLRQGHIPPRSVTRESGWKMVSGVCEGANAHRSAPQIAITSNNTPASAERRASIPKTRGLDTDVITFGYDRSAHRHSRLQRHIYDHESCRLRVHLDRPGVVLQVKPTPGKRT